MSATPTPTLTYRTWDLTSAQRQALARQLEAWHTDSAPHGLYDVHEVSASLTPDGALQVHVRGRMATITGEAHARGHSRGVNLIIAARQPAWLQQVVDDARKRLTR